MQLALHFRNFCLLFRHPSRAILLREKWSQATGIVSASGGSFTTLAYQASSLG